MQEKLTFEEAFEKLEKILEKLNEGATPLEDSLKLFEEANVLIQFCDKTLNSAQKKVETLIKNREGEIQLNQDHKPQTAPFEPDQIPF